MAPPDPPKRPPARTGSVPDLRTITGAEQPDQRAVRNHPGLDGAPQPAPVRKQTFTGLGAMKPPGVPAEYAPTQRAPSTTARTVRATPAAGIRIPPDETTPGSLSGDQTALLREELTKERGKVAQLERDARAAGEARLQTYPPKVERSRSPPPSSTPDAKVDRAIGATVRLVLARYGWPALAALGIGGAVLKPAADPAKTEATLANTEAMRADVALIREQLTGVIKREAARDAYTRCLEETLDDVGAQVLPAQDRVGSAQPLRAYVSRCQRLRP